MMIANALLHTRRSPRLPAIARLALSLTAMFGTAAALAQTCINEGAPAPLEICVTDQGRYNVWLNQQGSRTAQFYMTDDHSTDWVIGIGPAGQRQNFSAGYVLNANLTTAPEVVSVDRKGAGTAADPYIVENVLRLPGSGLVLTQQFSYVNGQRTLRKRWVLHNEGSQPVAALNFFHGGDATFGGVDSARSWHDPLTGMTYLTNNSHVQYGYMGTAAHPASPAAHFYGGDYDASQWIAQSNLPDFADASFIDAGYYLQWKRQELQPGHSWVIEARETWSTPGILQVISPAATHIKPSETLLLRAKVHNISNSTTTTAAITATDALGWTITPQPASLTLAPGTAGEVQILVTAPANATSGSFNTLSLRAKYSDQFYSGDIPLQVLNLDYNAPGSIALGASDLGASRSAVLTFHNQGDAVTLGSVDATSSLGPQFSTSNDTCSGQVIASGSICSVTLVYQPQSTQAFSGTLRWPIVAPVLANLTTNITATAGGVVASATASAGGSISPASVVAPYLQSATFTVTAQTGHRIHSVQGCGGTLSGTVYTTAALYQGCTVHAEFRPIDHRVNTLIIGNGSLTPAQRDVPFGQTASFSVTPAVNHHLNTITGCGGTLNGSVYTTAPISDACTVQANFLPNRYSVSSVRQGGGTITPTLAQVIHGSSATFTLTPATGHTVSNATGCGGRLNGSEYLVPSVTDHCEIQVQFAPTPPIFTSDLTTTIEVAATGLLTALPNDVIPQAHDHAGQGARVTLVPNRTHFPPGRHELQWRAMDARGVTATATQVLHVWPTVSMGADAWAGLHRGDTGAFRIVLNGAAPQYPFTVNYHVDGEHAEHDLRSAQATFQAGETEKQVHFAITSEPEPGTPQRQITITLTQTPNTGERSSLQVNLSRDNLPPRVTLQAQRDTQAAVTFDRGGGLVTLTADVSDPNAQDSHTYQWITPPNAAVTDHGHQLLLQPDSLQPGVHRFRVLVSDDGSPQTSVTAVLDLVITEEPAALPAGAHGWLASGLPDHPDYAPAIRHALPSRGGEVHLDMLETEPGLTLSLGALAVQKNAAQSVLPPGTAGMPPDSIVNIGGYFDFRIGELATPGLSAAIVIPQRAAVPSNAVYRKFDAQTGQWLTFIEDANNALASAPGASGVCPAPTSDAYRSGLNEGDWCVRLTIQDGGPNDHDGERNGVIVDPGGVGQVPVLSPPRPPPPQPGPQPASPRGGGGGGGLDWMLLCLATGLLTARTAWRRLARSRYEPSTAPKR